MNSSVIKKALVTLSLAIACGLPSTSQSSAPTVNIIPWPAQLQATDAELPLSARSRIICADEELRPLAEVLRRELYQLTGLAMAIATGSAARGDILLRLDSALQGEEYLLKIDDFIDAAGANYGAVAMATTSLLQATGSGSGDNGAKVMIPRMTIHDKPHSPYRSLLIDTARQVHTIDTLKQCVVMCRLYKIRYLQLHLSDDQSFTFESRAFPKLATPGRHFTQEEYRELVVFADERGVTLIPELDAPGHTTAMRRAMPELFGAPELSVINIAKEDTLQAMETLIEELCSVFASSPYFHIGADEAWFANLEKDEAARQAIRDKGYDNVHDLFYSYIVRMDKKIRSLGRKTVMWESFSGTGSRHVEIPRHILVMAWETAYQTPQSLLDNGYNIVNASWKPLYLTPGWRWNPEYIYGWNMFRWENHWRAAPSYSPIQLQPNPSDRITGGMMCSWESSDEMEIPGVRTRLPAMSERIWNPEANLPYQHFARRFTHANQVLQHLIRPVEIKGAGLIYPNYVGPFYNRENSFRDALKITMRPLVPGARIHYTLDNSNPTSKSLLYDSPFVIEKSTTLRAQAYGPDGSKLGFAATVPYEHHPIMGKVEGLIMQVPHDNGRGRHRTQFGKQVKVTLMASNRKGAIHYTTNGQAPNADSPKSSTPIVLKKSGVITARYFDDDGHPRGEPWRREFKQINAEINLTTGKPTSASHTTLSSMGPELAADSIVDRDYHWDSSAGAPQWWQVDLERAHNLNAIQVITYWDDHRYYQYRVDVSTDGEHWREVADFSKNTKPANSRGFVHEFDPIEARYIRVTMLRNSANPGLHLVEVRAFAE